MSERITPEIKPGLWFDGPNYTADAVIIDSVAQKILLIVRSDTGDWALPGGFVNDNEAAEFTAMREAFEETSIEIDGPGELIYQGIVNDPRNCKQAWIETSAYLFHHTSDTAVTGGDDARAAQWTPLAKLPPLYASHAAIVEYALATLPAAD